MRYLSPATFTSLPFRLALISLLMNLALETSWVFMPLYAQSVGASNLDIGFIAATYGLAFFASSIVFGRLSDVHGRLVFVRAGLCLSIIAYFSQTLAASPVVLLLARGFVGICMGITSGAVMAYTYESQKQIGSFGSFGAAGWLVGALLAAVIGSFHVLFLVSSVSSLAAFLLALTLQEQHVVRMRVAVFPLPLIKANYKVYLAFLIRQLGAGAVWPIFPLYMVSIGASNTWIALFDAINMATQVVAMRFVERFNAAKTFRTGLVLSILIFAGYGASTHFLQLIPVQIIMAFSWSSMFIGAMSYLMLHNKERGTASGLLYSSLYLSGGIGPFMGGAISHAWGFNVVMWVGAGFSVLGLLSSIGLGKDKKKTE